MNKRQSERGAMGMAGTGVVIMAIGLFAADAARTEPSGDPAAGREKSKVCAGCHGPKGLSDNPMYPHLAAQHEQYLFQAMKGYRDGGRKDPQMSPMVQNLSDEDLRDLAAFYAEKACDEQP